MRPHQDISPNLELLAGDYWVTDSSGHLCDFSTTHEIELLKLYSSMIWPTADMADRRISFLAQSALQLVAKHERVENCIEENADGFHDSEAHRRWLIRLYSHLGKRIKINLLDPSGGLSVALQKGRLEIKKDIDHQLKKTKVGVIVGDYLLRCIAHFPNEQAASINKAAFFIETGGYEGDAIAIPRHRSEILKAWSQAKPSIVFSLAAFYSEPTILSNIFDHPDPAEYLEQIWCDDLRRERFFGVAKYCEAQLTNLVPNRSRGPLLVSPSHMSTGRLAGLRECCPILKPFSEEACARLSKYRAPTSI
jgi:hypothetical protein